MLQFGTGKETFDRNHDGRTAPGLSHVSSHTLIDSGRPLLAEDEAIVCQPRTCGNSDTTAQHFPS